MQTNYASKSIKTSNSWLNFLQIWLILYFQWSHDGCCDRLTLLWVISVYCSVFVTVYALIRALCVSFIKSYLTLFCEQICLYSPTPVLLPPVTSIMHASCSVNHMLTLCPNVIHLSVIHTLGMSFSDSTSNFLLYHSHSPSLSAPLHSCFCSLSLFSRNSLRRSIRGQTDVRATKIIQNMLHQGGH